MERINKFNYKIIHQSLYALTQILFCRVSVVKLRIFLLRTIYIVESMNAFIPLAIFSILLFAMVLMKRSYVAQLLGPAIPEPFLTKVEDFHELLQPF